MKPFKHIISDPGILGGKPIISGTRISVELILEWLATGGTPATIHERFPMVSEEAIGEAIMYASRFARNDIFIELKAS